jgi:hypothetical protein
MKKILFLIAGAIILLTGFYLYKTKISHQNSKSLWDLVPADAVLIYESKSPSGPQANTTLPIQTLDVFKRDSIFIKPMNTREMIISIHIIGKEDFGIIYYHPDTITLQNTFFKQKTSPSFNSKKRIFEGYSITEVITLREVFSYAVLDKNLVISRESFLIEDAIRAAKDEKNRFSRNNSELFQLNPTESRPTSLYVNLRQTSKFFNLFFSNELKNGILKHLGNSMISDIRTEDQALFVNGFAVDSAAGHSSALSLFNDQQPVPSQLHKIISNRTLIFTHFGISDFNSWNKRRMEFCRVNDPTMIPSAAGAATAKEFYDNLGNEAGQCHLLSADHLDDLLILEIKKNGATKLDKILSNTQPPVENYSNYPIYKLITPELPGNLLWPMIERIRLNFYVPYDKYFLFAENIDVLKKYLNDLEGDDTWGKSSDWNGFFSSTSLENNLSVVFNGTSLFPWLRQQVSPKWNSTFATSGLRALDKGSFQLTRLGKNYSFSGILEFDTKKRPADLVLKNAIVSQVTFQSDITYLSAVKNHTSNAAELLVQTGDGTLMLLGTDLKTLFKSSLTEKVSGEVFQIDFYKNKKLQYLFIAGEQLYLIDRLGNRVKGFPKKLTATGKPQFLSIVDYDNNKNYRFLIASDKGAMTLMDKNGELLPGWEAKSTGSSLWNAPRLVRTSGKDFIISIDTKGSINAFNRKGEMVGGFPVKLEGKPHGNWFFSAADGLITVISAQGIKTQISLQGKIVSSENFVRSSTDSKFSLLATSAMNDYFVSRVDKGQIAILNDKGGVLFEKENAGSETLEVQYVELSTGEKLFSFFDLQQDFTYVFNLQGQSLLTHPLETTLAPAMAKRPKEKVMLFAAYKEQLKKILQ